MKENHYITLLQLRFLVGFLGEKSQHNWWSTAFFEPKSKVFLEPIFPRTLKLSQYHSVVESARRHHDEFLSTGNYHLFRLPEEIEQDLHALVQHAKMDSWVQEHLTQLESVQTALKDLAQQQNIQAEGPVLVGNIKELNSKKALGSIASAYLHGFEQNRTSIPFLSGAK